MTLSQLSRMRWTVSLALSAIVVALYFGFVLLIAFRRDLLAIRLVPGLTLGILLGALVIVWAWATTWVYVHWANTHFDRRVRELRTNRNAQPRGDGQ